jgi:hypothetical protein
MFSFQLGDNPNVTGVIVASGASDIQLIKSIHIGALVGIDNSTETVTRRTDQYPPPV